MSSVDYKRFDRQIALPQIDLHGQERLEKAHVVIVGVGGLGCAAAQSLALMGVGRLTLIDPDVVDTTNLARQALYRDKDVGVHKVNAAIAALRELNPQSQYAGLPQQFADTLLDKIVQKFGNISLLLDCTDNLSARLAINKACVSSQLALITAAAIRFEGMICGVLPPQCSPCYECLSKVWPDPNESCVERGIFGPVVNLIGNYQAMLAGQYLLGLPILKNGQVQFFDGLSHSWRELLFKQSKQCSTCYLSETS